MTHRLFPLLLAAAAATTATAQTLNVTQGSVTYSYRQDAVGTMTYTDGNSLTIGGRNYALSQVDRMTVDPAGSVTDHTVSIVYGGATAAVTVAGNLAAALTVDVSGADVTIHNTDTTQAVTYTLSGTSADGQLLLYGEKKATLVLNGLDLTNTDGPAINNQCGKSLYVLCPAGTVSTLTDGTAYADTYHNGTAIDQKGALFSEGQIYFQGDGTLNVNGNAKNAIASDDYIVIDEGAGITVNAVAARTGSNGVKANDGMFIYGGTLNIDVAADGAKGIKCDSLMTMTAGTLSVRTTGASIIETDAATGLRDTSSCAGIKVAGLLTLSGGNITLNSTGEGGKGINADSDIVMTGGTLNAICTGEKDLSNPKAVKSDTYIYVSGGSFTAQSTNGRATDCATTDRYPTVVGTPATLTRTKKKVEIVF